MIFSQDPSVVAVIPAHLASVRFSRKILVDIHGLPMIEHVRRRALMCPNLARVIVTTCDDEIASVVSSYGAEVVMTSDMHRNGTSRVAEAIRSIECSHVLLLQGDEPLLLPRHIDLLISAIHTQPATVAWNATASLKSDDELDRHSFVKCVVSQSGRIMCCFRRTPLFSEFHTQAQIVRKILGLIAYRKDFLVNIVRESPTPVELCESIEQMRILESDYSLKSVSVEPALPSVNEPHELDLVLDRLKNDQIQSSILDRVLAFSC